MAELALKEEILPKAKPILKWAGGKTQMLGDLLPKVPRSYGRYIEPFFGGGAMLNCLRLRLEMKRLKSGIMRPVNESR